MNLDSAEGGGEDRSLKVMGALVLHAKASPAGVPPVEGMSAWPYLCAFGWRQGCSEKAGWRARTLGSATDLPRSL